MVGILQVLKFEFLKFRILEILNFHQCKCPEPLLLYNVITLVNVYVDLVVFTRIAGTS